jgi:hypothetical protein
VRPNRPGMEVPTGPRVGTTSPLGVAKVFPHEQVRAGEALFLVKLLRGITLRLRQSSCQHTSDSTVSPPFRCFQITC